MPEPDRDRSDLLQRLETHDARVVVVGLGYVGLPVAVQFAQAGFSVVGIDLALERVASLREGRSYVRDVSDDELALAISSRRLSATSSYDAVADADAVLICVPTPLFEGQPDLSPIRSAGEAVAEFLTADTLVVLESTTYPGTTEEVLVPLLERSGLRSGADFLVAFSPERIDPGNPSFAFGDIPKIVGGADAAAGRAAEALYGHVVPKIVRARGTREAEMAKLIENTFRHVNIALVNELAVYAHDMGIDIWDAIEAAASKPFGYMPFWPGPGWGGHCIPLDPSYLSWRVRKDRSHEVRFVELAHMVNAEMPRHVVDRIAQLLNDKSKPVRGSRILGIGAAYKPGTGDYRGSPALKVLSGLYKRGAIVDYHDPLVAEVTIQAMPQKSVPLTSDVVEGYDLVVVFIAQEGVDWELLRRASAALFDCCNAYKGEAGISRL